MFTSRSCILNTVLFVFITMHLKNSHRGRCYVKLACMLASLLIWTCPLHICSRRHACITRHTCSHADVTVNLNLFTAYMFTWPHLNVWSCSLFLSAHVEHLIYLVFFIVHVFVLHLLIEHCLASHHRHLPKICTGTGATFSLLQAHAELECCDFEVVCWCPSQTGWVYVWGEQHSTAINLYSF